MVEDTPAKTTNIERCRPHKAGCTISPVHSTPANRSALGHSTPGKNGRSSNLAKTNESDAWCISWWKYLMSGDIYLLSELLCYWGTFEPNGSLIGYISGTDYHTLNYLMGKGMVIRWLRFLWIYHEALFWEFLLMRELIQVNMLRWNRLFTHLYWSRCFHLPVGSRSDRRCHSLSWGGCGKWQLGVSLPM